MKSYWPRSGENIIKNGQKQTTTVWSPRLCHSMPAFCWLGPMSGAWNQGSGMSGLAEMLMQRHAEAGVVYLCAVEWPQFRKLVFYPCCKFYAFLSVCILIYLQIRWVIRLHKKKKKLNKKLGRENQKITAFAKKCMLNWSFFMIIFW